MKRTTPILGCVLVLLLAVATTDSIAQNLSAGICTRTEQVRTAIIAEVSSKTDCATITATDLAGITGTLNLKSKSITSLKAGDFNGLTNLSKLILNSNSLSSLPEGVFDQLTSLEKLNLHNNHLSSLPEGVFDDLTNLENLNLNNNRLSRLSPDVFDSLTKLETLGMRFNKLSSLPKGIFDKLEKLRALVLAGNPLQSLSNDVFDKLTNMMELHMSNTHLTSLPEQLFDKTKNLSYIGLHYSRLSSLPAFLFDGLTKLEYLVLSNNSLTSLPAGIFDGLYILGVLWLDDNDLTCLPRIQSKVTYFNLKLDKPKIAYPTCKDGSPSLEVSDITATTAKLTLSGHATAWLYKWDGGQCTKVNGKTSEVMLSELTPGTDYVITAYNLPSCPINDNSALGTVEFTTLLTRLSKVEELTAQVEDSLAVFGRGVLSSIDSGLGARLRGEFGDGMRIGGYEVPLGGFGTKNEYSEHQFARYDDREPRVESLDLLEGTSFALALSDSEAEANAGEVPGWKLWGLGDIQSFQAEHSSVNGELRTAYLGIDTEQPNGGLMGLALSNSRGRTDYTYDNGTGLLRNSLISLYPYLRLRAGDNSTLWAILGLGRGRIENRATGLNSVERGDLSKYMFAGGGRYDLNSDSIRADLALVGDAAILRLNAETDSPQDALDDVSTSVSRLRFGLEGKYEIRMERGVLSPFGQLSARYDGGDGETGSGVEIAGGLRYRQDRLSFEMVGRAFRMGGGNYRQNGWGIGLELRPREYGEGISLSLSPKWGDARQTSLDALWSQDALSARNFIGEANRAPELKVKVGYGFRWRSTAALMTPYAAYDRLASGGRRMNLGIDLRLKLPSTSFKLDVRGELEQSPGEEDSAGIYLDAVLRF